MFFFSLCGYSNHVAFQTINEDDLQYVEKFVRNELHQLLLEKCVRLKITLDDCIKSEFFGAYTKNISDFKLSEDERRMIFALSQQSKELNKKSLTERQELVIVNKMRSITNWFCNSMESTKQNVGIEAPPESQNLLTKMIASAKNNSLRPKQGYRYANDLKSFAVYNRILSGRMGYRSVHLNLGGCFPSISTVNRYIHRSDKAIIEGVLRIDELKNYLEERKQPLWVALSEDATRVDNRVQYDSHTNQLIGFVLPLDAKTGMPIPLTFKARNEREMLQHFSNNTAAHFVNTIMAKPLGNEPSFCLVIFGSDSRYNADDVARRWSFISSELEKTGIGVLSISSDSDPKYNSAMRQNSGLGSNSNKYSLNGMFKCGIKLKPPYYVQDYPHLGTKLRCLFLKTISHPEKLLFGNYFIKQSHIVEIFKRFSKDKHLLTETCLNPIDRQNFESVLRICDVKVINLLKRYVKESEATVMFLQIMSDVIAAFMDKALSPTQRIKKLWYPVFIVRIWRYFVLNNPKLTLKENFMSTYCYYCIEQNAHSLIYIILFLKKNSLTHLFLPDMLNSQPCEQFYRQIRSLSSTSSTVTNCSVKGFMHRINRIQHLNEISNDKDSGFVFPKALKLNNNSDVNFGESDFPNEDQIIQIIFDCKQNAIEDAVKFGLIKKNCKFNDQNITCQVPPYIVKNTNTECASNESVEEETQEIEELCSKLASASLKNFADKFKNEIVPETSTYVEVSGSKRRFIVKKTTLCWLIRKECKKSSSDRRYRVMHPLKPKTRKNVKRNRRFLNRKL